MFGQRAAAHRQLHSPISASVAGVERPQQRGVRRRKPIDSGQRTGRAAHVEHAQYPLQARTLQQRAHSSAQIGRSVQRSHVCIQGRQINRRHLH